MRVTNTITARLTDGTTDAEVVPLSGYNAQAVAIVDGSGNQVTSFGGGTQYTEDAAAAADPVGTAPILVRADTPGAVTSTNGDNVAQRATNYGAAFVQVVSSSGAFVDSFGGGTQYTEGDTDATITGTALLMEGAANALVVAQGTATDGLLVNLGSNNDVTVTGTVTATATDLDIRNLTSTDVVTVTGGAGQAADVKITLDSEVVSVSGTITANLATGTNNIGDVDVLSLPGTAAEAAALPSVFHVVAGDDGTDTQPLQLSAGGDLKITLDGESVAVTGTVTASNTAGDVAHDSPDSGNPLKTGGIARTANPTAVAALDRVASFYDSEGRQIIQPYGPRALTAHQTTTISASTSETTVLSSASSLFLDLTGVIVANTSATAARLDFRDSTAGTVRFSIYAPAGQTVGFMPPLPVTQAAVTNNWTAQSSASVTDLRVFVMAVKKTG